MSLALSSDFVSRMASTFGPAGAAWVERLPTLIEHYRRHWQLVVAPPFPELSYNYVAPAALPDGTPVVLKLGVPRVELSTEIEALRLYNGRGAARLLAADEQGGALLLERLHPGVSLVALADRDDEAATRVAARAMRRIWHQPPPAHRFASVATWAADLAELRPHFAGGTGPFPPALVDQAQTIFAELLPAMAEPVVLHGDLHHYNILAVGPNEWRIIDPKGVIGEPAYEVGALIRNPIPIARHPQLARVLNRRLSVLAEELSFDRQRILAWSLAQAVLSAWWSYENGTPFDSGFLACAEALATLH